MNSTAIDRECSKETHLCNHELLWHGWLRDALPAGVIFRPYSAGTVHRKPIGQSDATKATAREAQAINVREHLFLILQDFLGRRFASSRRRRSNLISTSREQL